VEFVVKCMSSTGSFNGRIREFAPTVPVYMFTAKGDYEMMTLEQLMPKSFGPEDLS
jgi:cytidine deaminase